MIYGIFAVALLVACIVTLVHRISRLEDEVMWLRHDLDRRGDNHAYRLGNLERIRATDAEICRLN